MKISKIKIRNLFGITEKELDGKSIEVSGNNGLGKTSILDAIRYGLTNNSERDFIVKNGETEGEIYIETDTGLIVDRKKRTASSDYKSIKENGKEVSSPESFLKEIFTPMQLNPVEFAQMSKQEQNRVILDLIEFDWDINWIKEKFGEIPEGVDYTQNILQVLSDIQAEDGTYFKARQDVNREIRNKIAFIEDIAKDIPAEYNAKKWEEFDLTSKLKELMGLKEQNNLAERAKTYLSTFDNKVKGIEAELQIEKAAAEKAISNERESLERENARLEEQIKANKDKINNLGNTLADKIKIAELKATEKMTKLNADMETAKQYSDKEIVDVTELQKECDMAEEMKKHLNEYKRMKDMQEEIQGLREVADEYTRKIELARNLPAEVLATATIPIAGLSVKDGLPLIDGKPVSNLSEGEKLMLCVDVAISKPNSLKLILLDGVEKLSEENKQKIYKKCQDAGLQFIATKTDNNNELIITEF